MIVSLDRGTGSHVVLTSYRISGISLSDIRTSACKLDMISI